MPGLYYLYQTTSTDVVTTIAIVKMALKDVAKPGGKDAMGLGQ